MPQNTFFPRNCDLLVNQKTMQRHFFPTFHPLSPVLFATATVVAFVLFRNYRFNFHCYTQREATPTHKSAQKWRCDLSRLLAQKITKGIHLCKPASLNRPIGYQLHFPFIYIYLCVWMCVCVCVCVNESVVKEQLSSFFQNDCTNLLTSDNFTIQFWLQLINNWNFSIVLLQQEISLKSSGSVFWDHTWQLSRQPLVPDVKGRRH